MSKYITIVGFIGIIVIVLWAMMDYSAKCRAVEGITVNRGYDCWVEGKGYVNPYKANK